MVEHPFHSPPNVAFAAQEAAEPARSCDDTWQAAPADAARCNEPFTLDAGHSCGICRDYLPAADLESRHGKPIEQISGCDVCRDCVHVAVCESRCDLVGRELCGAETCAAGLEFLAGMGEVIE